MKNKHLLTLALAATAILPSACVAQKQNFKPKADIVKLIDQNFKDGASQYKILMKHVPVDSMPETYNHNGTWKTQAAKGWTTGFYVGSLMWMYQYTKDKELYEEGVRRLKVMEPIKTLNSHDIGFMMYDSYGVANRIKSEKEYKDILITSAQTLAKRFNPKVGCTMSWASQPGHFRVIIDNMMNLELLMWATKATGDSSYAKVAITHANTTMKNHFRPDYSSYHLVDYNPETGEIIKKQTVQGAADESAWARGQGWGLYGFTMMYRETKDKRYLEHAKGIANFILSHPNLPADKIPYWDFNAPGIPNTYRDVSAGALYASALLELSSYVDAANAKRYVDAAETILRALSTDKYKAAPGQNGGYMLMHSVGHLPKGALIDVPLTYADYYFIEAMLRYRGMDSNLKR
jgi:unsaturated chondroitin disaccharide hydrolase